MDAKPLISVILPAFNEEVLLKSHLEQVHAYLATAEDRYRSEMLVINDGSIDRTGDIADQFATERENVRVLHHPRNFGLGQALKFGFANTRGDFVVVLDVDLSYDVQHIGELVDKMRESHAKIVLASPYMEGGSIRSVPWLRRTLSIAGNRFLKMFVRGHVSTLTGMVRAYDGPFIRSLDLRSTGMDIMPEAIYKALVLRASIHETPARLDWEPQLRHGQARTSSLKLLGHIMSTVLSGFFFRPFLFFVVPGLLTGLFAAYVDFWMIVHFVDAYSDLSSGKSGATVSAAFSVAYARFPHTFVTALLSTTLAIQLIGMGSIALQSKRYFEDLFHLGSTHLKDLKRPVD